MNSYQSKRVAKVIKNATIVNKPLKRFNMKEMYNNCHFWIGFVESLKEFNDYFDIDIKTGTSKFAQDIGFPFKDEELDKSCKLTCLQPNFDHKFQISELLCDSPLKKEDIKLIEELCKKMELSPNSYVYLFNSGPKYKIGAKFSSYYYIGCFEANPNFIEDEELLDNL